MSFDWKMILFVWLILGIASSMIVYWDMDRRKKVEGLWALLCIPLSVFGILLYALVRGKGTAKGRELPTKPDYGKPEYRFKDGPKPAAKEEPKAEAPAEPAPKPEPVPEPKPAEPLEAPPAEKKSVWKEEKPAQPENIEGIPRCPKCRAAVSSFDEICGECGAKLK